MVRLAGGSDLQLRGWPRIPPGHAGEAAKPFQPELPQIASTVASPRVAILVIFYAKTVQSISILCGEAWHPSSKLTTTRKLSHLCHRPSDSTVCQGILTRMLHRLPHVQQGLYSGSYICHQSQAPDCQVQMALKCADMGHASAPWDLHLRWVKALEAEMFSQVDYL